MKKLFITIAAVLLLGMTACTKTPEERAYDLVEEGLKQGADDPSSLQDLDLNFVTKKEEVDAHGNRSWHHYVSVSYRENNKYGALVRQSRTVVLDEECTKVEKWNYPYN